MYKHLLILLRRESFENVVRWLDEVNDYCNSEISIALVGNKCDLENEYL